MRQIETAAIVLRNFPFLRVAERVVAERHVADGADEGDHAVAVRKRIVLKQNVMQNWIARAFGRRVGLHIDAHVDVADFTVVADFAWIGLFERAVSHDDISRAVTFAPHVECVACLDFQGAHLAVAEAAALHRDVVAEQQDAARAVVMEEAVAQDDVVGVEVPVENDEAVELLLWNWLVERDFDRSCIAVDNLRGFDWRFETARRIIALTQFQRRAWHEAPHGTAGVLRRYGKFTSLTAESAAIVDVETVIGTIAEVAVEHFEIAE